MRKRTQLIALAVIGSITITGIMLGTIPNVNADLDTIPANATISAHNATALLGAVDRIVIIQDQTIADLNKTIADLNKTIAEKDAAIAPLQKELDRLNSHIIPMLSDSLDDCHASLHP